MDFNKESRTVNAKKNAVSAIGNKIILLILTFISRKFFIIYIGVEYLGINGLFSNILTLLSMADLGLGTAMNVSLYKPISENDTRKITALLNYFKTLYRIIAIAVAVIGISLMPFLKYLVNMDSAIPHLQLYYLVFVLKNVMSYLYIYKSSLIRADQKNYVINRVDAVVTFCKVVLQFFCVIAAKSYFLYILLDVVGVVAHNVIVSHKADREYSFINNDDRLTKEEQHNIFSDISSVFLYKIAWSLLNGTDNILMSVIVGTVYVGLYSNYLTITSNLEMLITLLFTSLTASVGNLVATSSPENRYKTFKTMQMVSFWLCGIVCIGLLFLTQDFIQLWLGKDFVLSNLTLVAIVLNVFFSICMRPVWTFREGTGMYKQIRYIMFITAFLNLVFSVMLGNIMGISGIIFATSLSKFLTYFWYEPNILFRDFFKKDSVNYYLDYFKNTILMLVVILLCAYCMKYFSKVSVLSWILKALICMAVVNAAYFIRYCRSAEFDNLRRKIITHTPHRH